MKYYCFGTGYEVTSNMNVDFLRKVDGFVDNDPAKWGKIYFGKSVKKLEEIIFEGEEEQFFIITPRFFYDSIRRQLEAYGLKEDQNFTWAPNWCGNEELPSAYGYLSWEDIEGRTNYSDSSTWASKVLAEEDLNDLSTANEKACMVAGWIDADCQSVLDLGAGHMHIKKYLSKKCKYYPVDVYKRVEETIVCDLSKGEFPNISVDCIVCSGILEYIENKYMPEFVGKLCKAGKTVLVMYNPIELIGDFTFRQHHGYVNHLRIAQLIRMFNSYGFLVCGDAMTGHGNVLLKFKAVGDKH